MRGFIKYFCIAAIFVGLLLMWVGVAVPLAELRDVQPKYADEYYQALLCRDYYQAPIAMGTFWLGHLWTGVFGDSLFNLRMLSLLLVASSIALGCCWLYRRTRNMALSAVTFLILSCFTSIFGIENYDWNTSVFLPATLTAYLLLRYAEAPSLRRLAYVGVAAGVLFGFRLPMGFVLPVILAVIIMARRGGLRPILVDSVVGLAVFAATFLVFVTIMTGSPAAYIGCWEKYGVISGHTNIAGILEGFSRQWFKYLILIGTFPAMLVLLAAFIARLDMPARQKWISIVAAALVCVYLLYKMIIMLSTLTVPYFVFQGMGFLTYVVLSVLAVISYIGPGGKSTMPRAKAVALVIAVFFPMIFPIGSDVMAVRFYFCSFVPLVVWVLWAKCPRMIFAIVAALAIPLFFASMYCKVYRYHKSILAGATFANCEKIGPVYRDLLAENDVKFEELMAPYERARDRHGELPAACGHIRFTFDYLYTDTVSYSLNLFHSEAPDYSRENIEAALPIVAARPKTIVKSNWRREEYLDSLIMSTGAYVLSDTSKYYRIYELAEPASPFLSAR